MLLNEMRCGWLDGTDESERKKHEGMVRRPPGITGVTGGGSADLVGDNGRRQTGGFLRRPMEATADLWIELDTSGAEWRL